MAELAAVGAFLAENAATIGTIATAAGGAVSAFGALQTGANAKAAAQFKAQQEQQAAGEARASANRMMLDKQRQTRLIQSNLVSQAAASGAATDDPTVLNLESNIAGRGEYDALMELYKGENRARGLQDQATATLASGDAAEEGSLYKAGGTLLESAGSLFKNYGKVPDKRTSDSYAYG